MKTIYSFLMILAIAVSCQDQSKTSVKEGIAEVNGTQLYYEMAGKGQPIVLIHGNGVDSRQWNDQFMALASNFQVVRYDVRGFGKSAMPVLEEKYSHHDDLKACKETGNLMNEKISNSKMVIMEDGGHCMNMDKPGRFNEIVTDFINDL